MIFGMTFWGFSWLIVKIIIGVSLIIFLIKLLLAFGLAGLMVWAEKKKK